MKTYFTAAEVPLSKASAGFTGQVPPEKDQKSLAWSMLLLWIYAVTCDSNDCSCSAAQWSVVSPVNTPPSSAVAVTSWSAAFLPVLSSSSSKCLWATERDVCLLSVAQRHSCEPRRSVCLKGKVGQQSVLHKRRGDASTQDKFLIRNELQYQK